MFEIVLNPFNCQRGEENWVSPSSETETNPREREREKQLPDDNGKRLRKYERMNRMCVCVDALGIFSYAN